MAEVPNACVVWIYVLCKALPEEVPAIEMATSVFPPAVEMAVVVLWPLVTRACPVELLTEIHLLRRMSPRIEPSNIGFR